MSHSRMPVAFIPHGGGPWPFVELGFPRDEVESLAAYLRTVATLPFTQPTALLVISGHWEEPQPTVMTSARPPMLYDYYGFPPESYTITWPAPGDPALAARVQTMLGAAGFSTATDNARGFDHGTFIPLKVIYPDARIPAVQLSLMASLDPAAHLALGRALAPLRDEGVFIIGSGMTFHNLRALRTAGAGADQANLFDAWLRETMQQEPAERERRLTQWAQAPGARFAHPREEHLLPLMVATGAAGGDRATSSYGGTLLGMRHSAFNFGTDQG